MNKIDKMISVIKVGSENTQRGLGGGCGRGSDRHRRGSDKLGQTRVMAGDAKKQTLYQLIARDTRVCS